MCQCRTEALAISSTICLVRPRRGCCCSRFSANSRQYHFIRLKFLDSSPALTAANSASPRTNLS